MLEAEKGYKIGEYTLDWLEVEKITKFYELANLQISILNEDDTLTEEQALYIAKSAIEISETLGITVNEAVNFAMCANKSENESYKEDE